MKCCNYIIWILCIALFCSCGVKRKLKKADTTYEAGGYDKAGKLYRKVAPRIKDKELKAAVYYRTGEAFRKVSNYAAAERAYDMAIKNKYPHADAMFFAAQSAFANENYKNTDKFLTMYQELEPANQRGVNLRKSMELADAEAKSKSKSRYTLTNVKEINSNKNDYAPAFSQSDYESLYFSSSRKEGRMKVKTFDATGQFNSNIYSINQSKTGWEKAQLVDGVNTVDEEGACVFDATFTTMFYTLCKRERGEKFGCDIVAVRLMDDSWGEPEELKLVNDTLVAAHPALSADGLTLYFASNQPGGYGGLDLWKVTRGSTSNLLWSEPINLGPSINTDANEMYPSIRKDTLYFSSNGRVGFGGYDIFKATPSGASWNVSNMGKPFNSNSDDFAIIFEPDRDRGFFTSRRKDKGSKGGDDIYAFVYDIPAVEFNFKGSVRLSNNKARIANADIRLIGSDGTSLKRKSGSDGSFTFRLQPNTEYLAVVRKEGYFAKSSEKITTEGLKVSKDFVQEILLTSFERPLEIPNIFFDFGKATLTAQSTEALGALVTLMEENPKIVVELRAHTDNRGGDEVNLVLSQKRAQAIIDYMIPKGIDEARMKARGYGESLPRRVDEGIVKQYPFLQVGQILNDDFIKNLDTEANREVCHALNRRTEIQVISNDYESNE